MKKLSCFLYFVLIILMEMHNCAFAQSESSAVKTIKSDNYPVTEPMIAVNPTEPSNFITVYSNWHDAITRHAGSSRTTDGGASWAGAEVPFMKYFDQADPTVAFDADGNAFYSYLDLQVPYGSGKNAIVVARSTDKGSTWSDTSIVVDDQSPTVHDKPWITVDCSSGQYQNTLYIVWTRIDNFTDPNGWLNYSIYLSYRRPGQTRFLAPIQVSSVASIQATGEDVEGAFAVVGNNGDLYIFWSKELSPSLGSSAKIMMRKLTDGGQTFAGPERELVTGVVNADGVILGGAFPKAHSFPSVAVNPVDGSLNLVYGSGANIYFSKSTDNGNTWSTPAPKSLSPSFANQVWNPSIACNTQGKIAIAYYAAYWYQGASLDNSTSVLTATSSDGGSSFSIHSDGAVAFNPTTWKYSDYIGVAYNSSTYWGVWPQAIGTGTDIDGRYRTVTAVVENVDDSPQRNSVANYVSFDGTSSLNSPYATAALLPGRTHTIGTSPSVQYQGITYSFVRWEDETGAFIGNSTQASVQIESHRYRAVFSKNTVNAAVKNEFKEPNGAVNNGGTVNIDNVDYLTDNLPGKQKTFTAPQGEQHTFKANDQSWGAYYRGFNTYSQHDGGWLYPDLVTRSYNYSLTTGVQPGPYTAKYRNRYTVHVNGSMPETGGTVTDVTSPQNVWQFEAAVTAPSQITSGGRTFQIYGWSDGSTANPNPNPPNDNSTYTALYKGTHLSNNAGTWSNNSLRKFVQTPDGWMHMVYECSLSGVNHVFYENKSPTGNWQIIPLSGYGGAQLWLDNGGGSSPSIDFLPNAPSYGNAVVIVWRESGYIQFKSYFYNTTYNYYYPGPGGTLVSGESAANTSVAGSSNGYFIVVWESKNSPNCLKYQIQQLASP